MAAPSTPSNFIAQQGNAQVYLTWDIAAGATSYNVLRSLDNVSYASLATVSVNNYLDTSVSVNTQYYYKVNAANTDGSSPNSSAQAVVPTSTGVMSLGQVRLLAQQEADRVNSNFVTTSEWNTYINQSYFELYDMLVTTYENYNVQGPVLFQTDGTNQSYALPTGLNSFMNASGSPITPSAFYKLIGVDCGLALNNNAWVTLQKFNFIQRNRYVYPNITSSFVGVFNLRYDVVGSNIMFIPTPSAGQYIRMWYVPRVSWLLKDTDPMDGISGWTEYVVVDAALKALMKEESDVSALAARKLALKQRIQEAAANRDAGAPESISDMRRTTSGFGTPNGDGSFGGY